MSRPREKRAERVAPHATNVGADQLMTALRRRHIAGHGDARVTDVLSRITLEEHMPPNLPGVLAEILAFVFRAQAAAAHASTPPTRV